MPLTEARTRAEGADWSLERWEAGGGNRLWCGSAAPEVPGQHPAEYGYAHLHLRVEVRAGNPLLEFYPMLIDIVQSTEKDASAQESGEGKEAPWTRARFAACKGKSREE